MLAAHTRKLAAFLILLLLANASQAVEVMTHDAHDHGAAPAMTDAAMHGHGSASDHDGQAQNPEDCFCEDICCVSSVGSLLSAVNGPIEQSDELLIRPRNLYQSPIQDLLLPPPNH